MRAIVVVMVVGATGSATRADGFVELGTGASIPVGDKVWTNTVTPSPVLAVRAGSSAGELAALLSAEWTPLRTRAAGFADDRYRLTLGAGVHHHIKRCIMVTGRVGIGLDITHASDSITVSQNIIAGSTGADVGFAAEGAIGIWQELGGESQLGIELAVPVGVHRNQAGSNAISFDYTSVDIELLGTLRFGR